MEKNYQFLNMDINRPIHRKLTAIQYDNKSRYILVSVFSNFIPYDLTYATVKIYGIKGDKTVFFNNAKIVDAKKGQFEIDLTEQCLAVSGDIEIQILILGVNGERLSTNSFILNVKKTLIDPLKVISQDEWGVLVEGLKALAEYDIYKGQIDKSLIAKNGKTYKSLADRLDMIDSELDYNNTCFTLKEFKDEGMSNSQSLERCLDYIYTHRTVSTEMEYDGVSLGNTVVDLCGEEIILDETLLISRGDRRYSHIIFQNGTLKASESFSGLYLVHIGELNHTRGIKFLNITFDCNLKCSPYYLQNTLNTVFNGCTFTNYTSPAKIHPEQTHETIIDNCYFVNKTSLISKTSYALELGVDSHVTGSIFVGFKNAIDCIGGANTITNNHFYAIEDYAVVTRESTVINNIYGNYFDCCSVYIEREYGVINVCNNVFLNPKYAAGIHSKYLLKTSNISNNTYTYTTQKREKLFGIRATINEDILTSERDIFDKYDVGAISLNGDLCIIEFLDAKNVKVSYNSNTIKTGVLSTFYLYPTNLSPLAKSRELMLNSTGTVEESVTNGIIPNMQIITFGSNSNIFVGNFSVTIDRIKKMKYIKNSCYTKENQGSSSVLKIGNLPSYLIPEQEFCVNVIARNPNQDSEIYGSCSALIRANGEISIIKKSGDFSINAVEYYIATQYS